MNIVKQRVLERVTDVDIHLRQRFARRGLEELARFLARTTAAFGPTDGSAVSSGGTLDRDGLNDMGVAISGVEAYWTAAAGSTINVTAGSMLAPNPAPGNEARPVPWVGQIENDDCGYGVYRLPLATTVTPAVPIASALVQAEWWIVYGTPSEATIETDTNSAVFNEGTGAFDVTTQPKIVGHQLSIGVLRGAAGADITTVMGLVPAGSYQVAWIWVPVGSTDLASAQFYDVRRLVLQDQGPNIVEGAWSNPIEGEASSTSNVFKGRVRARLQNEWLEARLSTGPQLAQLVEPGANWGGASQTFNPAKVAWLYLAKVNGYVPRLLRVGAYPIGNHPTLTGSGFMHGCVVLSPKPPKLRLGAGVAKGGRRWDLRPSSAINLPTAAFDSLTFAFSGGVAGTLEAICIGMLIYKHTDASGLPQVAGSVQVTNNGWACGEGVTGFAGDTHPLVAAAQQGGFPLPNATIAIDANLSSLSVGGDTCTYPINAVRLASELTLSGAAAFITWGGTLSGRKTAAPVVNGGVYYADVIAEKGTTTEGSDFISKVLYGSVGGAQTMTAHATSLAGYRLPFGEPLVTLLQHHVLHANAFALRRGVDGRREVPNPARRQRQWKMLAGITSCTPPRSTARSGSRSRRSPSGDRALQGTTRRTGSR